MMRSGHLRGLDMVVGGGGARPATSYGKKVSFYGRAGARGRQYDEFRSGEMLWS